MRNDIICDNPKCINNPDNNDIPFDPDNGIVYCDKCYLSNVMESSIDELMDIHYTLDELIESCKTIEDVLRLPLATEFIIDDLLNNSNLEDVKESIRERWKNRFNALLQYKLNLEEPEDLY